MWQERDEVDAMLVASAREHYRREGRGRACRAHVDREGADASLEAAVKQGWFSLLAPETAGGAGLGLLQAALLARVMGEHVARDPFISIGVMPTLALNCAGGALSTTMLRLIGTGKAELALAWQEEGRALDLYPHLTTLQQGPRRLALNGRKTLVAGHRLQGHVLVSARREAGVMLACLPVDRNGIQAHHRSMSDGSCVADFDFVDVQVDDNEIIARDEIALHCLRDAVVGATVVLCAYLEGLAAGAVSLTTAYLKERRQFDQPLAEFQALRHRIADVAIGVELAGASWRRALGDLPASQAGASLPWTLRVAKARASEVALLAGREGVQFHGAFGYTEESDIGLYLDAALRASSWLGNAAEHRSVLARMDMPALAIHG